MSIQRLENVGIVVDDLEAVTQFFVDLGLEVVGEGAGGSASMVEGDWVDRVTGLKGNRTEVVMVQTPDGHGRLELMRLHHPEVRHPDPDAPANTHGIRRVAFSVDDIDRDVKGLQERGFSLLGEVVDFEGIYKLCYVCGPEGIIVMLAEELPR